jgi:hypothetical protein
MAKTDSSNRPQDVREIFTDRSAPAVGKWTIEKVF